MDVAHILSTLNRNGVEYILAGGANFALNHGGPTDQAMAREVDLFINDTPANRCELNFALQDLGCRWADDAEHGTLISADTLWPEDLHEYRLASPQGAISIFRTMKGLDDFEACKSRAEIRSMRDGEMYYSLSDEDMYRSNLARPEEQQNKIRIEALKHAIQKRPNPR